MKPEFARQCDFKTISVSNMHTYADKSLIMIHISESLLEACVVVVVRDGRDQWGS